MNFAANLELAFKIVPTEFLNTLYMVFVSAFFSLCIGLPLGITLVLTERGGLKESKMVNLLLGFLINIGRSIPFAILIVAVFPLTRWIVGTSIGTTASIVPLTLAAAPFFARVVEGALKEVDASVIEAGIVMGSTNRQIVQKVLLPEALPSLINGATLMLVTLIGYSAMAGLVGGGGLGKVAIQYGYQRFNGFLMLITLVLLLGLVECIQWMGNGLSRSILRKWGKE